MSQVLTGSKAILRINGTPVAFVGGLNINQENTLTDIDVIGQLEVAEHAETGHKVNFSVNYFKVVNPAIAGTAQQIGIEQALLSGMRNQAEALVEVVDDTTGQVIYTLEGVKFEGGSGSVNARDVWQGTWNFKARYGAGL
jgi:hypothetical protein